MKTALAVCAVMVFLVSNVNCESASDGWSSKMAMASKAVKYAHSLYDSYKNNGKGRILGDLLGGLGGGDDDDGILLVLLAGAALLLPIILGAVALAAAIPFLSGGAVNNFATTGLGTGLGTGITGTVPTITASTFNPGGRRRRSVFGTGFPTKLMNNIETFLSKLE